ncbi:hypothetical protein [Haloarcula sp. CBA1127]|uniref:hypothetical protein n=1 Tax=Haloarcula sp. CBA1127 TaxID=1765055 RepID=UPI000A695832|nr:hypothetical protein [Haloarcula sp. CBA1127]
MVPPDDPFRPTRRSFLNGSATAVALGLTTGLSGCTGSLPPLSSKPRYGRVDVPDAGPPEYRRWLPAGWESETDEDWVITYAEPGRFDGPVPEEFVARRGFQKMELDYFGIGYENYDSVTSTNLATVIEAEFTADDVASTLADTGYEPDGSYRGYDVYARSDVRRRAAVRDGVLVWSSTRNHNAPDIEATIDAGHGHSRQFHEESDAFAAVTDAVGASRMLFIGGSHPGINPEVSELGADAFRIDDDVAYHLLIERYETETSLSEEQMKRALGQQRHELTKEAQTVDVRKDGRFMTVSARVPARPDRERDPMDDPPHVTWGGVFDAETQTVTLRHEVGESADADLICYDIDTPEDKGQVEKKPLWPDQNTVSAGDETTIDLGDTPTAEGISVVYGPMNDVSFRILFELPLEGDR